MSCEIILTDEFKRQAKKLSKKHRSLKNDLQVFFEDLKKNPFQGIQISENVYKVRLAIKSKGKGKSGGARVINYLEVEVLEEEEFVTVNVLTIYDKSEYDNISLKHIEQMVAGLVTEEE